MKRTIVLIVIVFGLLFTACVPTPDKSPYMPNRHTIDYKCMEEVGYIYKAAGEELPNQDIEEFLYADYTIGEWIYLRLCWEEGWRP